MILITGASRGIGRFLFETYSKSLNSNDVYGTFNNTVPSDMINARNMIRLDVTNISSINDMISKLKSSNSLNEITLINSAGISYNAFAHKAELDKWKEVIETNLVGTFNVIHSFLPIMRENNFGRIINFSSVVAQKSTPGVSAYATSKSALWGLAKSISVENASKGITINNINLGYSELGMIKQVPDKFKEQIIAQIPNGSLCSKEDIFNCVESIRKISYLNGTSIDLNGGIF